jgi:hypothetical protein
MGDAALLEAHGTHLVQFLIGGGMALQPLRLHAAPNRDVDVTIGG